MRKALASSGVLALVAVSGLALQPPASAEERTCRGTIGAQTVDNLRVPQGATCTLTGTVVKGTIKVESGAKLYAERVRVIGNVQAEDHQRVNVKASKVGGSIQLVQGANAVLRNNKVNQDVQSFENKGVQTFTTNTIDGNLQCKANAPAPTGSGNVVGGNKEDQCASL